MAHFSVVVTDEQQRQHVIETECRASQDTTPFAHYRDATVRLPVIRVPIGLPIYRMANIRTRTRQKEFARANGRPPNWFAANQETTAAQKQQHEFLTTLSKKGQGITVTPVYEVLKTEAQHEDLLVTRNGVVVNGNRRLSAMRELFGEDPGTYGRFSHVNVLVLPLEAQERDLQSIEMRLQMRPETKLPYEWVDEAMGVRDLRDGGRLPAEIAALMGLSDEAEIDQIISRLNEGELYLSEYLKRPEEYHLLYESEQMFLNWERALREPLKNQSNAVREGARAIAHVLTSQSRNLEERVHTFRDAFGKDAPEVLSRLSKSYEAELDHGPPAGQPDDIFGEVAEADSSISRVKDLLRDSDRAAEMAQQIKEIQQTIMDERAEEKRGQEALNASRKARTTLANIDLGRADTGTLPDIEANLNEVIGLAQRLLNEARQRREPA